MWLMIPQAAPALKGDGAQRGVSAEVRKAVGGVWQNGYKRVLSLMNTGARLGPGRSPR